MNRNPAADTTTEEAKPQTDFVQISKEKAPPTPSTMRTLWRLLGYLTRYRAKLALVILFALVSIVLNAAVPYLFGLGINEFMSKASLEGLERIALLMLGAAFGGWLTATVMGWILADVAQGVMYSLRKELFNHIQTLSLRFYDRQPIGELMSRVVNDIESINQFLSTGINQFISAVLTIVVVLALMLSLDVTMTIAVLAVVPLMLGTVALTGRYAGPAFTDLQENLGELNGYMEETISGQRVVRAYGQEKPALDNFTALSVTAREADGRANFLSLLVYPVNSFLGNLDLVLVSAAGAYLVIGGSLEVGLIATFLGYARQFTSPISQLSQLYSMILMAAAGAERVFQILDEQPQIVDKPDALAVAHADGKVNFDNVDFSYVPDKQILYDNTFEALPGQMIGLCGPTGAGKSTIINLLSRFYDIQSGDIQLDDRSIYDLQTDSLRRRAGIVLQVPFLFSETVMYNLRYGQLDATDEDCIKAAKMANAHEFIEKLPDGYDTVLAERGSNLSQGQGQLLTIARAILANPDILVLDEATSSVDTRTEKNIQEGLQRLMEGRTSFVIAHRLATIRDAAKIIALNQGRIEEIGPHDELMEKKGFYYELYMKQFKTELLNEKS